MMPARTWEGLGEHLYKSEFRPNTLIPYGELQLNVLLAKGNTLLNHFLHSYNEREASLYQDPETIVGPIPEENIRIIANANEMIYQFLPCETWNGLCDHLAKNYNLQPRLSGNDTEIPNISVKGKSGSIFKGALTGFNREGKIRLLCYGELLAKSSVPLVLEKSYIKRINEGNEILYSDSPLNMREIFGAVTSDK